MSGEEHGNRHAVAVLLPGQDELKVGEMTARSQWIIQKTEVESDEGIVCAHHPAAAAAGAEMLARGGNAIDAAVAAGFAVGVAEPFMSGVGGIAHLLYREAATGRVTVFDGTSVLPRAIRPELFPLETPSRPAGMYGWPAVEDDRNNTGWLTPAVPGMPACLLEALDRFGRLARREVLAPAIQLAAEGVTVDENIALTIFGAAERIMRFSSTRAVFFGSSGLPLSPQNASETADRLRQPDLADTLRLLADQGASALYTGAVGARIAEQMAAHGGLITREDLAAYRVRVFDGGISIPYRDCTVTVAPETGGGLTVAQALRLLDGFDLAALGFASPGALHLEIEALRRAFRDRFQHLGDPATQPVPYEGLLSAAYADARRAEIRRDRATPDATAGDPWRFQGGRRSTDGGSAAPGDPGHTTHLTVIDRDRNMVALTSTLGAAFGSGVVVPGTGILLNNGTTWFDPRPGTHNSIAPGRRILWAGSPALVTRAGKPLAALGAPGGRRLISAVLQVIVNLVDFGMGAQDAVGGPRVHCEGAPALVDSRFAAATLDALREMGHDLTVLTESLAISSFGRPNAVLVDPASGRLRSGVYPFRPYVAIGL